MPNAARHERAAFGVRRRLHSGLVDVYLDHAATTPVRPESVAALTRALQRVGNPSSTHAAGRAARDLVEDARERVAIALDCEPAELIFTSGGTEADNLAVSGLGLGRRRLDPGRGQVVVSAVEHPAVLEAAQALAGAPGTDDVCPYWLAPVTAEGLVDVPALAGHLARHGRSTALISVMRVNNETGVVQPVDEIVELARRHGAWVHSDAVQAVGHVPVSFRASGLDAMSVSGHKLGSPVGIGALVARRELSIAPVEHGGGQERGVRSGTVNAAGAAAFAAALESAVGQREEEARRLCGLRDRLASEVIRAVPGAEFTGPGLDRREVRSPHVAHLTFAGCESEALLFGLDMAGVRASSGSACQAGVEDASHVLLAMGLDETTARSAVRFTFGWTSTEDDVDTVLAVLPGVVERARAAARARRHR